MYIYVKTQTSSEAVLVSRILAASGSESKAARTHCGVGLRSIDAQSGGWAAVRRGTLFHLTWNLSPSLLESLVH